MTDVSSIIMDAMKIIIDYLIGADRKYYHAEFDEDGIVVPAQRME